MALNQKPDSTAQPCERPSWTRADEDSTAREASPMRILWRQRQLSNWSEGAISVPWLAEGRARDEGPLQPKLAWGW